MGETTGEYLLALVQGDVLLGELLVQGVDLQLEGVVLDFETFGFLALALTGVVCSGAVALDTFDAALFLLVQYSGLIMDSGLEVHAFCGPSLAIPFLTLV